MPPAEDSTGRGAGLLDAAVELREGEALPLPRLESYLREHLPETAGTPQLSQFPGGYSNLTYLLRWGDRELVLRRPPAGSKVKTAHDMGREFRILSHLWRAWPLAPRPLHYCRDADVLGAPFYVMERVRGVILRASPPAGLHLGEAEVRRLCESFIDNLASLHALDYGALGLADLGRPEGYMTRQTEGWTRRYAQSRTDEIPEMEELASWLCARIPEATGAALIHNDYKFDNLVLDPADLTRILAVLDWEMSTLGDPLADLGIALGYWVEPGDAADLQGIQCFVTRLPGSLNRAELAERYGARTGRDLAHLHFYYCFALFRLAVIAQQIYYRHAQGLTRDKRFAGLIHVVRALARWGIESASRARL